MDNCQDIDLVWFNVVDDSVRPFEDFSNLSMLELPNHTSGLREFANLL